MAAYTVIDDPSAHFQIMTYVGNQGSDVTAGSEASFTFNGYSDLKPDWMWFKGRNYANDWTAYDSTNGFGLIGSTENGPQCPSTTHSEGGASVYSQFGYVKSFNTDGFTGVSGDHSSGAVRRATWGYASECIAFGWKAGGGSTFTNSDGDINSSVQKNTDAGFSITSYSPSNDTARNIGHGLGAVPKFIIIKALNRTENWHVFHYSEGTGGLIFDDNSAHNTNSVLGDTLPTSSVYKVGTDWRMNGAYTYTMYAFADVQGYSKFGQYYGNGEFDGTMVYTGFKPKLVIVKEADGTEPWVIVNTETNPYNPCDKKLSQQTHQVENGVTGVGGAGYNDIDILSNGFKMRTNNAATNESGTKFIYAAWAEQPLVTSGGVPATAQ